MSAEEAIDLAEDGYTPGAGHSASSSPPLPPPPQPYDAGPTLDRPLKQIVTEAAAGLSDALGRIDQLRHEFDRARADAAQQAQQHAATLRDELKQEQTRADQQRLATIDAIGKEMAELRAALSALRDHVTASGDDLTRAVDEKVAEMSQRVESAEESATAAGQRSGDLAAELRGLQQRIGGAWRLAFFGVAGAAVLAIIAIIIAANGA